MKIGTLQPAHFGPAINRFPAFRMSVQVLQQADDTIITRLLAVDGIVPRQNPGIEKAVHRLTPIKMSVAEGFGYHHEGVEKLGMSTQ
ncbi:hypothetical protein D3C77_453300 [compost metagenome]